LTNRTQNPGWHWPEGIGLGIYAGMRAPMSRNNWITSKMRNIVDSCSQSLCIRL
jgi:hypothetical protein